MLARDVGEERRSAAFKSKEHTDVPQSTPHCLRRAGRRRRDHRSALAATDGEQTRRSPIQAAIMFNMLDQNGDGSIDSTEISALTAAIVAAVDSDGDGVLSEDEFKTIAKGLGPRGPRGQRLGRGHVRAADAMADSSARAPGWRDRATAARVWPNGSASTKTV